MTIREACESRVLLWVRKKKLRSSVSSLAVEECVNLIAIRKAHLAGPSGAIPMDQCPLYIRLGVKLDMLLKLLREIEEALATSTEPSNAETRVVVREASSVSG